MANPAPAIVNNGDIIAAFSDLVGTGLTIPEAEAKMLQMPQVDCPVIHRFGPGVYMREVKIPAGCFALGHYQKKEHVNIFLKGRVVMFDPESGTTSELAAPMIFTSKPGRKIGYIKEEVVWLNVYATDETDVETLEDMFLDKSPEWQKVNASLLERAAKRIEDIEDYKLVLKEFGVSEETVRQQAENEEDQIPIPFGNYKFAVSASQIEGKGVFATGDIEPGEIIGPARINGKRTPIERYVNHSKRPNAKMVKTPNDDIYLVATAPIKGCAGGFLGDEITTNYRLILRLAGRKEICRD